MNIRKTAVIRALILLVAVVMLFAGCGASASENAKIMLKVWAPANQIEKGTMDKMCEAFKQQHPEWQVTFTNEIVGEDKARDEILKDVSAAGDVYFFANDQIEDLQRAGAIAIVSDATEKMVRDTMPATVVDTVIVDGKCYGIPFTHNTFFMYYDKSLLNENDIGSLESIISKNTPDGVYNFLFDAAGGWKGGAFYYGAGLTIYGKDQVSYSEGCNWNNPTGIAVTKYLIDLMANPRCVNADDYKPEELASDHRLGAWFDGAWNYDSYKQVLGDDLGVAALPTFNPDGNTYQLKGFYGSKAIGINAQTKFMEQALAFATFLGSKDMQILRFEESAQIPTNIEAGKSDAVMANEIAVVTMKEAEIASVMQPTNANFGKYYWENATALFTELKSGAINHDNVKEKMDTFCKALAVAE